MKWWIYTDDGVSERPYSKKELSEKDKFNSEIKVCREGGKNWKKAEEVDELQKILDSSSTNKNPLKMPEELKNRKKGEESKREIKKENTEIKKKINVEEEGGKSKWLSVFQTLLGIFFATSLFAGAYYYDSAEKTSSKDKTETSFESNKQVIKDQKKPIYGRLLINDAYFYEIKKSLENAKSSITIVMYVFHIKERKKPPYDPALTLAKILKKKAKEGLDVKVIMSSKEGKNKLKKGNKKTAKFLNKAGVKTAVELIPGQIHAKLVWIDKQDLFISNHNWTWAGLKFNEEVAGHFRGSELTKRVEKPIKKLVKKAMRQKKYEGGYRR